MIELALWLLLLMVSGVSLALAVTRVWNLSDADPRPAPLDTRLRAESPRFFARSAADVKAAGVPTELLLLQLEQHIRLEQAAAESFHLAPTAESLHTRTSSPLVVH